MKVKILKNFEGCLDGINTTAFVKGQELDLEKSFAEIIINRELAEKIEKTKKTKDVGPAEKKVVEPKETK